MKKLAATILSLAFAGAAMIAPALATTDTSNTNGDYTAHAVDCLVLMFTNPAERAAKCGTPDVVPAPPSGSTGFHSCVSGEIDPFGIDGVQYKTVAILSCCLGSIGPEEWDVLPGHGLVWNEPTGRVTVATPCGPI